MSSKDPSTPPLREQLLIESDVQSALLWRAALHGGALAIYFTVIQFFAQSMLMPEVSFLEMVFRFVDEAIYWVPALILLAPLFAYDLLKLSNRFAGPIFRLRRELIRLDKNESKDPISFRETDFWSDLQKPFNAVRDDLLMLRTENVELKQQLATAQATAAKSDDPIHVDD